jgi:hypothetical protein
MAHEKIKSLIVFVAIFAIVGGISWTLVNAHQSSQEEVPPQIMPKLKLHEDIRDAALNYVKDNHPETAQFTNDLSWIGGRTTPEGIVGAETYTYNANGWQVTIQYPVVPNPVYEITVNYNAPAETGIISIPYAITWTGNFGNGAITETNYTFAQ